MAADAVQSLADRLDALECELSATRAEVVRLRLSAARRRRSLRVIAAAGIVPVALVALAHRPSAQGIGQTVKAPLIVIDAHGEMVARIGDSSEMAARGLIVYNPAGAVAGQMTVRSDGAGIVSARDGTSGSGDGVGKGVGMLYDKGVPIVTGRRSDGKDAFWIAADRVTLRSPVEVVDASDKPVVRIHDKDDKGSRGIHIYNPNGNTAVQLTVDGGGHGLVHARSGASAAGYGAFLAWDAKGQPTVGVGYADGGLPRFAATPEGAFVYNDAGTAIVGLSHGDNGGKLQIANEAGAAMVEAGVLGNGRGVVRAYPLGGPTPIPIPTLITGWGGGSK